MFGISVKEGWKFYGINIPPRRVSLGATVRLLHCYLEATGSNPERLCISTLPRPHPMGVSCMDRSNIPHHLGVKSSYPSQWWVTMGEKPYVLSQQSSCLTLDVLSQSHCSPNPYPNLSHLLLPSTRKPSHSDTRRHSSSVPSMVLNKLRSATTIATTILWFWQSQLLHRDYNCRQLSCIFSNLT